MQFQVNSFPRSEKWNFDETRRRSKSSFLSHTFTGLAIRCFCLRFTVLSFSSCYKGRQTFSTRPASCASRGIPFCTARSDSRRFTPDEITIILDVLVAQLDRQWRDGTVDTHMHRSNGSLRSSGRLVRLRPGSARYDIIRFGIFNMNEISHNPPTFIPL